MKTNFDAVLQAHRDRYPLMQTQDLAKLVYQNEFGPAHLDADADAVLRHIRTEWAALPPDAPMYDIEPIGNGLCRFHFIPNCDIDLAAPLLTRLFLRTMREHTGTRKGVLEKLQFLETDPWLEDWKSHGCPAVHHSDIFRAAYAPHYRVLKTSYAEYFPVLLRIAKLLQRKERVVIAIDGRCGSGKSCLADLIASLFDCNVFHADDYYLPLDQRAPDWEWQTGGNMDLVRFRREVLLPAFSGEPVQYRPYDCDTNRYQAAKEFSPLPLTVIEGSYSHHPSLDARYDLKLFLTCSSAEQIRRLRDREGEYYRMFKVRWIPMEERYIGRCGIGNDALNIDTSNFLL